MDEYILQRLQTLVGRRFVYQGHTCTVIELLDRENSLILRRVDEEMTIQGNQFGEATRRVHACHTIMVFDEHETLNPLIEHWLD